MRRAFNRAAENYDAAAVLQREVCARMLERLLAARDAGWPTIAHLPIEAEAFRASTLTLTEHVTQPGPAFAEGYATWWAKAGQGRAGAFAIPLAEAYLGVASTARK